MAVNCFKKLNYHDNIPHLYRPALVRDVQTHKPEAKAALDHFDIASLADGWVDLYEETHVGYATFTK